jgi:subtilase family serine protease
MAAPRWPSSLYRVDGAAPYLPGEELLGALPASTPMRVTVSLRSRNPGELTQLATAVSTPGNPDYGHFLTVAKFAQRFGASPGAVDTVAAALQADGLSIAAIPRNNLTIEATGSSAAMARAFNTNFAQVRTASGRVAFANRQAPSMAASVARYVQGVIGLDDLVPATPTGFTRARRHAAAASGQPQAASVSPQMGSPQTVGPQVVTGGPQACRAAFTASQSQDGYTFDELAGMYGFSSIYQAGDEGQGQTVAVIEEQPTQASDITAFEACYPGTSGSVTYKNVGSGVDSYTLNDGGDGNDGEAALDIEVVLGLAPRANVIVYQEAAGVSTAASDILSAIVSANVAKVISSSWGVCEQRTPQTVITLENKLLQEAATQGQSFFAASGDSGSTMCYEVTHGTAQQNDSLSVIDPAAQPFATGVGGTFLGTSSDALPDTGVYPGEYVWNDGIPGGSFGDGASGTGGGVSDQWAMPSYQSGAAAALGVIQPSSSKGCNGQLCREVPDVSADSDPNSGYIVYANGGSSKVQAGWQSSFGTSAATPLWAALTALANASASCRGLTLGFVNPALYKLAGGSSYMADFHDITAASPTTQQASNNTAYSFHNPDNPNGLYPVTPGYDMATGLGSPIAGPLAASMCALRAPVYKVTVTNPGMQISGPRTRVSLRLRSRDSGGKALRFSASGLPAGLRISQAGVIRGSPTTPGRRTVTVRALDTYNNAASTRFVWRIVRLGRRRGSGSGNEGNAPKRTTATVTLTSSDASETGKIPLEL